MKIFTTMLFVLTLLLCISASILEAKPFSFIDDAVQVTKAPRDLNYDDIALASLYFNQNDSVKKPYFAVSVYFKPDIDLTNCKIFVDINGDRYAFTKILTPFNDVKVAIFEIQMHDFVKAQQILSKFISPCGKNKE